MGREVPMNDFNDPRSSRRGPQQPVAQRWRVIPFLGGSYRIPLPPGPPPKPSKAERQLEHEQEERGEANVARFHVIGLFRVGVVVISVALAAVVLLAVLALTGRH
jgi:hypothetical protein